MNSRDKLELANQIDVAMGRAAPDLLITGGNIVNTLTGEIYEADVAVKDNRIVRVGDVKDLIKHQTKVIDATDAYVLPGFIDAHLHTESTLMTPTNFASITLPRGTTTVVVDPHEIGNVLGVKGLELYVEEVKKLPLEFLIEIPSCVPAAATLETAANIFTLQDYEKLVKDKNYFALAEMMNFPGVIYGDPEVLERLALAEGEGLLREGHAPGLMGNDLQAYITAGVSSDHETFMVAEAIEKLRLGMIVQLREGSYAKNLLELANGIKTELADAHNSWQQVITCTDDKHADDILDFGHIDYSLRLLVNEVGLDPITAVQIATLNPAQHLQRRDLGAVAPGRLANIVTVDNLKEFTVQDVVAQGKHVAHKKKLLMNLPQQQYPKWVLNTIKPKFIPQENDFFIPAPIEEGKVTAHVIGVIEHSLITDHLQEKVHIEDGKAVLAEDQAYFFLLDRHNHTTHFAKALVRGFGFTGESAVASTVAHDSHQLLIAGNDSGSMHKALQEIIKHKGGQTIVSKQHGEYKTKTLALPYAGLMSTASPHDIANQMRAMKVFSSSVTTQISEPFMSLSFMALPVIPALKLTDRGLVDVDKFELINLFAA